MEQRSTKNSLPLTEMIINILFFLVLLSFCLRFFANAYAASRDSVDLNYAVQQCGNLAAVYQSGDGSLQSVRERYPSAAETEEGLVLYMDRQKAACSAEEAAYCFYLKEKPAESGQAEGLHKIEIICRNAEDKEIYRLTVCCYEPGRSYGMTGGSADEQKS